MTTVKVGLVGCGFVAELHMYAYRRVYGLTAEVKAVSARGDHVVEFAKKHRIPTTHRTFRDLIADKDIDVIDICTPPNLHASMIVEAMRAGKHVICEKPFAGYFGSNGDQEPIGKYVRKALMYERVMEALADDAANMAFLTSARPKKKKRRVKTKTKPKPTLIVDNTKPSNGN